MQLPAFRQVNDDLQVKLITNDKIDQLIELYTGLVTDLKDGKTADTEQLNLIYRVGSELQEFVVAANMLRSEVL